MKIQVLDEAEDDLQDGREFYNRQERGVGEYFATALAADIDSVIRVYAVLDLRRDPAWIRRRLTAKK